MMSLKVVVYFDGRVGHEKQTLGVLNALMQRTRLEIVEKRSVIPSAQSAVKNWFSYLMSVNIHEAVNDQPRDLDLIVGTGSHTHIPMLLLRKRRGGKAVTCMAPDSLLRKEMDLCLVPVHDNVAAAPNIFTTIGPPCISNNKEIHERDRGLVLIGGLDDKSHIWNSEEVFSQIKAVIEKDAPKKWTITSSRRTPEEMIVRLQRYASENPAVTFYRADETPRGWVEDAYDRNECVWVTADSISMVYEALSAGCRIGIFPMRWKKQNGKFHRSEQYLIEQKMVTPYEAWISGQLGMAEPKLLNEAARCAEEILRRWWPEKLK